MNSYFVTASKDAVLVLILSVIAINSLVEHHAIDFCYNVFLVTGMTSIGLKKDRRMESGIQVMFGIAH